MTADELPTTTIEVSVVNARLLDEVGAYMRRKHPDLWGDMPPTCNAVVGFVVARYLTGSDSLLAEAGKQRP